MLRGWSLGLVSVVALFAFMGTALADEKPALKPGNYIIYYAFSSTSAEQAVCLLQVEEKEGKLTATVEDSPTGRTVQLKKFSVDGNKVEITLDQGNRTVVVEGTVSAKDPQVVLANYGDGKFIYRARLGSTDKTKLERADLTVAAKLVEPVTKLNELTQKVTAARTKLRQATDAGSKADAQKEIAAAQKEVTEKSPALYREILDKHGDSPTVVDAAVALLRDTEKNGKQEDVSRWVKGTEGFAEPYGNRFQTDTLVRLAAAIGSQKGYEALGLELAEKATKKISDATPVDLQLRVLKTLYAAQEIAGKTDAAKQTEGRIAKIEEPLDKEYLAKVPPFKPTDFEGRKGKSERVVVMELFTGAQCPPCVAADVGFDGLIKSYQPKDLILLQYHMHIPGPDPLTNDDTQARWNYYQKLTGTPSTIFNGKPQAGGGGAMANSEMKYKQYRGIIDPLLEEEATIKLSGEVTRKDDKLTLKVTAESMKEGNDDLRLRFVLVEENVRYTGSNGLRFHHHVVRAMPGGVAGMALKGKSDTKTVEVNLSELRKNLTKYLDNYAKTVREFPYPDRPMAMKHLKVVALVQDDSTKEILQAVQLEVPEAK